MGTRAMYFTPFGVLWCWFGLQRWRNLFIGYNSTLQQADCFCTEPVYNHRAVACVRNNTLFSSVCVYKSKDNLLSLHYEAQAKINQTTPPPHPRPSVESPFSARNQTSIMLQSFLLVLGAYRVTFIIHCCCCCFCYSCSPSLPPA